MDIRYPNIHVNLVGKSGNAFAILGAMKQGLKKGGVGEEEIQKFMDEAMAGSYDNLLCTCMNWVYVE